MRIYDIILIIYLKFTINSINNLYQRRRFSPLIIIINREEKYEINKLIRKKRIRRRRE